MLDTKTHQTFQQDELVFFISHGKGEKRRYKTLIKPLVINSDGEFTFVHSG